MRCHAPLLWARFAAGAGARVDARPIINLSSGSRAAPALWVLAPVFLRPAAFGGRPRAPRGLALMLVAAVDRGRQRRAPAAARVRRAR